MTNRSYYFSKWLIPVFAAAIILLLPSCVTQKKRGEASGLKKAWHNINGRYNGYYNAGVIIDESKAKLNEIHKDNYNQVLSVYEYVAVDNAKPVYQDLDNAIEKSSVDISIHRVGKWTDDCYLQIAESQYLKKDYESAEETLLYLIDEYNPTAIAKKKKKARKKAASKKKKATPKRKKKKAAKKKKKKNKPLTKEEMRKRYAERKAAAKKDSTSSKSIVTKKVEKKKDIEKDPIVKDDHEGLFKHKPAYQSGQLWLGRVYTERKMYREATSTLRKLENNPKTFKHLKPEIVTAKAHLLLTQKEYDKAVPVLEEAIKLTKKRKDKARLSFILGQLYQKSGQEKQAYQAFNKVVKYRPNYEMLFSAKLNVALNSYLSGNSSAEDAITSLEKLLKDSKNSQYKDQLYFTLAKLYLKQGNKEETIAALKNGLAQPSENLAQKAESYLMLADLYFEQPDYIQAQAYYDSTRAVIAKTDERHDRVVRLSENLRDIALNLKTIQEQDSLLRIAGLSDKEQKALAIGILEEKIAKAAEAQKQAEIDAHSVRPTRGIGGNALNTNKSSFALYKEENKKKGMRNFKKKWGDRELKDNWRRSASTDIAEIRDVESGDDEAEGYSDADIQKILENIPNSAKAKAGIHKTIYDAMFELGKLYRDRLEDSDKSVAVLEDMLVRYADSTRHELDAYYYLYVGHTDLNNTTSAKKYYDLITSKYPNTTYARVLQDPDYLNTLMDTKAKVNKYFDATYALYDANKVQEASQKIAQVDQLFGNENPIKAKFALLAAMINGTMNGRESYISGLKKVVAEYKNTEEEKRAKEILRVLGESSADTGGSVGRTKKEQPSLFNPEADRMHFMLVVLDGNNVVVEDAKVAISNFNRKHFKLQKFRISNIFLGSNIKEPIIVIRKYKNQDKAMDYFNSFNDDYDLRKVVKDAKIFPISQGNYRQILRQKSLTGYDEFFKNNY